MNKKIVFGTFGLAASLLATESSTASIFVGNLSTATTEHDLQELYSQYGTVKSTKVIVNRDSGLSKGFGFVEMERYESEVAAVEATDGMHFMGKLLRVNVSSLPKNTHRSFSQSLND